MKKRMIICIFAVIAVTLSLCFIFTTSARTANRSVWSGEIGGSDVGIVSNFLSANGQSVKVADYDTSYEFSINIYGGFTGDGRTASISVDTDGTVGATFGFTEFYLEPGQTVTVGLTLTPWGTNSEYGSADVTMHCGDTVLFGTFTVPLRQSGDQPEDITGRITYCPKWYNKKTPIIMKVGTSPAELWCDGDIFPPLTSYKVNGVETVLYDGGLIFADAGADLEIDLSRTDYNGEYLMISTAEQIFNLKNTSLPTLATDGEAISMTGQTQVIPVVYTWENADPEITVEKLLTADNGAMSWKSVSEFTIKDSQEGLIELDRGKAEPGTYRVTLKWLDSARELYSLEFSVFVRYE